ncbi:MAG TPA: SDR family NAD(P)-dependent oxidoreductase [Oceanobacillus sp.]|nr:SDR family NAD(P)-dependent oxidoreductase [Oceanobacillus sp.]
MTNRFQGQVAIVTGGASGIGLAIAERIAREGGQVTLFDVNPSTLRDSSTRLQAEGLSVEGMTVDISDGQAVENAIAAVVERSGQLDILVNSAGIVGKTATNILDYDLETFENVLKVNLVGTFLVTKAAIRHMLPRNYGRILLIASMAGKDGNPGMAGYTAAKAGVIGLVKGVGKEYAQTGITVNGLAPAVIATPMNADTAPEQLKYMVERIPMQRLGTVEEVAALACWIVSKEASFNTGFVFDMSGGRATY